MPRRKLCLFVDSACLLASASHMNIFPNVTRPQLRAKNQHYSDEATSSSPLVWWPAVQRRGKRRQDSTGRRRRRVYCILHACLRIVVISRIKLSCLMPFCPLPPPAAATLHRRGCLRRRRVLSSCLMCALQALSSLLPCEHLLHLKCVRF